jgi:hypothetical protein
MMTDQTLRQELQTKLEQLSTAKLREVLDFVSFLLSRQDRGEVDTPKISDSQPEQDPLLEYIGAGSHGALARDIDEEVYGT